MPKAVSQDLFHLIKSLDKGEKRFFKLYSSRKTGGSPPIYLKLFDTIDRQKEYDENKIIKKIDNISINEISGAKNYLHQLILTSLNLFHAEISINAKLKELLRSTEILYNKGLYIQCNKILDKAKKLSIKHEKYVLLHEILEWKMKLVFRKRKGSSMNKELMKLIEEDEECLHYINNTTEYRNIVFKLLSMLNKDRYVRTESELEKYKIIMNNPLLKSEVTAHTYYSKSSYHNAKGIYAFVKGDLEQNYQEFKKVVELIEKFPHFISDQPHRYLVSVQNLILCCVNLKKHKEAYQLIERVKDKLKNFSKVIKYKGIQSIIFEFYHYQLNIYSEIGEFEKGVALIDEVEEGLKYYEKQLADSKIHVYYFQFFSLYFGIANYTKAKKWLNKLLNDSKIHSTPDIDSFSRIMQLILLFELRDYDLLEYLVKSTNRFLETRKRFYQLETVLLNFIRKIIRKVPNQKELIVIFKELRQELTEITKDPFEKKALEYFDFISWVDSKIENRPFAEVVREKAGKIDDRKFKNI